MKGESIYHAALEAPKTAPEAIVAILVPLVTIVAVVRLAYKLMVAAIEVTVVPPPAMTPDARSLKARALKDELLKNGRFSLNHAAARPLSRDRAALAFGLNSVCDPKISVPRGRPMLTCAPLLNRKAVSVEEVVVKAAGKLKGCPLGYALEKDLKVFAFTCYSLKLNQFY